MFEMGTEMGIETRVSMQEFRTLHMKVSVYLTPTFCLAILISSQNAFLKKNVDTNYFECELFLCVHKSTLWNLENRCPGMTAVINVHVL